MRVLLRPVLRIGTLSLLPRSVGQTKSHDQTQRLDEGKYTLLSPLIEGTIESHDRGYYD